MRRAAAAPEMSASPNVRESHRGTDPANLPTRYLCIAPYLRRAMLPREITEPVIDTVRPPMPVGRSYAFWVLFGIEGRLPMPGVVVESVRRHCRAALAQTTLRDAAAIAAVLIAAFLAPLSTLITAVLLVAAITLIRRSRPLSPPVLAAATGVAVALIWGWHSGEESYAPPLMSLGACFLIYLADVIWSLRQIRKLSRKPSPSEAQASTPAGITIAPSDTWSATGDLWTEFNAVDKGHTDGTPTAIRVYYDKDGIIGAGTSFSSFPLTIPLDKPLDDKREVTVFTAGQLLTHIQQEIRNQGVGDGKIHGYAYSPGTVEDDRDHQTAHFTYGLPDLKVDTVAATPLPHAKKYLMLPLSVRRLDLSEKLVEDHSPSAHPERYYLRATTVSWDGQLVVSIYTSVALQGHYLRIMIHPYVLAPIVAELKSADDLLERHLLLRACAAVQLTSREFVAGAKTIRNLTDRPRKREKVRDPRPTTRSTRERYAQLYVENMSQKDDADRIIRIVELKIAAATLDYLGECNIDTGEYEATIINKIENYAIDGGAIYSGTFSGPIATATGQGNATATDNKPTKQKE